MDNTGDDEERTGTDDERYDSKNELQGSDRHYHEHSSSIEHPTIPSEHEGGELLGGGLSDISHSIAFNVGDKLLAQGTIDEKRADYWKLKYHELQECVLSTYDCEKTLLRQAKQMNQDLHNQQITLDKTGSLQFEDNSEIGKLKRELMKATNEVSQEQRRCMIVEKELEEVQEKRDSINEEIETIKKYEMELVEPQIREIQTDIREIQNDLMQRKQQVRSLKDERDKEYNILHLVREEYDCAVSQRNSLQVAFADVLSLPQQIASDCLQLSNSNRRINSDLKRKDSQSIQLDYDMVRQRKKIFIFQESLSTALAVHEKQMASTEAIERVVDAKNTEVVKAKDTFLDHRERLLQIGKRKEEVSVELKQSYDVLQRTIRHKDKLMKSLRIKKKCLSNVKLGLPLLENDVRQKEWDKETLINEIKQIGGDFVKLKAEVSDRLIVYSRHELKGNIAVKEVAHIISTLRHLHDDLHAAHETVIGLTIHSHQVRTQKDFRAHDYVKLREQERKMKRDLVLKEYELLDNEKRAGEMQQRMREHSQLFEVIKTERNKYVNMIQASSQCMMEMKEKLRILGNELEFLRSELKIKEKELQRVRVDSATQMAAREVLRSDQNKQLYVYNQRRVSIDRQICDIEHLNSTISSTENEMIVTRRRYEAATQARDRSGLRLLESNDELALLYEKSNAQELVMKNGHIALEKYINETKMLKLCRDRERSELITVPRTQPGKVAVERSIEELKKELIEVRLRYNELDAHVENGKKDPARWRQLPGSDPESPVLEEKLDSLERHIQKKDEKLLELNLIIDEVDNLVELTEKSVAEGKEGALQFYLRLNQNNMKTREISRKMMSQVAELSMQQAQMLKLQVLKRDSELSLADARRRLKAGEAPSDDAALEWLNMDRRSLQAEESAQRERGFKLDGVTPLDEVTVNAAAAHTTRPNAYIPNNEELKIPRPYGQYQPFKPSEPSAQMRHVKKPNPPPLGL